MKKFLGKYGFSSVEDIIGSGVVDVKDDDDIDFFGFDDEEVWFYFYLSILRSLRIDVIVIFWMDFGVVLLFVF